MNIDWLFIVAMLGDALDVYLLAVRLAWSDRLGVFGLFSSLLDIFLYNYLVNLCKSILKGLRPIFNLELLGNKNTPLILFIR